MSRLERWSRLKRGEIPALPETTAPPRQDDEPDRKTLEPDHPDRAAEPSASPAPGSLDHTLPDPDTLPAGSDIKAYLASGVSAGLRKRALRRLFAADHYGIRDGLDDYDDDYRQKLQPLASEVAERLRNWTRRQVEDDNDALEENGREAKEASHADAQQATVGHDEQVEVTRENIEKEQPNIEKEQPEEEQQPEELVSNANRTPSTP